ncbi:MAG: cytochrome c oxidase subunit 3 [Chitinophagales bacterium]|nr:cytochrome c oxidase subunit 3 [Bacteroidota bacterium]MBX7141566.1 cytochrome c oxidase subunit 3 [Chitinophagales bacterium]
MAEATLTANVKPSVWNGGHSPFKVSWGKLMMWYFLVGDSFSFASFLITYGALRFSYDSWPLPTHVFEAVPFFEGAKFPLGFVSFMTFTLIMSSVTMVLAVHYGNHEKNRQKVAKWLFFTIIGGIVFLSSQAWEWTHLITEGMNMHSNPFGASAFGWLFFTITGFHGFHVFTGVCINTMVLTKVMNGDYDRKGSYEMIEKIGLYWHFVDLVWVFVFMAFYLL